LLVQDIAILAMSAADVEAVIREQGSWGNVNQEINRICKGSTAGQALFGFAYTNIVCEAVTKCIDEDLLTLEGKHLDAAAVEKWERSVTERLATLVDLSSLPPKREAKLSYRGCDFVMQIGTARQEMDFKLQVLIKHAAVHHGLVPPLTFENELVDKSVSPLLAGVSEALVEATKKARETANALLDQAKILGSEGIKQVLDSKEVHLVTVQREFHVEINFLRSMMGEGGKARVEKAILDALPLMGNTDSWTPSTSLQAVTALQGSPLYSFVPSQVQQTVVSSRELLHAICNGMSPRVDPARATSFMRLVLKRCELFVSEAKEGNKTGKVKYVFGAEALHIKFDRLDAAARDDIDKLSLKDLDFFKSFEWLLGRPQLLRLKVITDLICTKAGIMVAVQPKPTGEEASSSSSSKVAASARKRKSELMHAASELFS
jgi:hypothetical protein